MNEPINFVRRAFLAVPLVLVSGFCALIYQVVWTRELRLIFGASTAASSAVVAIFIAGLGFGGLFWGRRSERSGEPLKLYAQLEVGIALSTALTPLLLPLARAVYLWSGGSLKLGMAGSTAVRLSLTALMLGPPTFLMGGTLPAIARAVESERDASRRGVAALYGINTLGAVAGCALSTFVLLEQLGSRTTLLIASGLNLAIGALAFLLARRTPALIEESAAAPEPVASQTSAPLVYASAAVVGFAFFLMELVWYRLLQPLLGGTVFTFGLILAIALLGIGIGSALYAVLYARRTATSHAFALTCLAEALCLGVPLAIGDDLAIWTVLLRPLGGLGFHGLVVGWAVIASCYVLPAAIVAGFQFPLLIGLLGRGRSEVARDVGRAYAANTAGAMLGALAGGFGLVPALGALGCYRLAAGVLALWGGAMAVLSFTRTEQLRVRVSSAALNLTLFALTIACLFAEGPTAAYRQSPIGAGRVMASELTSPLVIEGWLRHQRRFISYQTDGIESALGISRHDGLSFVVNGKSDGNSRKDAATQVMGGLVGAALRPRINKALVIGLGTGSTAGWLGKLPEIKRVDVVELEPAVIEVARACTMVNAGVLDNPKVRVLEGDARELLAVSRARYDLIFSEPSNPYRAGVASLYTHEFYRAARRRLRKDGVYVQWLQAYAVDTHTLRTVYATLRSVFPHVETFYGLGHDLLLVASKEPLEHDVATLSRRLAQAPFPEAQRAAWHSEGVEGFYAHYLANGAFTDYAAASSDSLNTDDRTEIEFGFGRNLTGDPHGAALSMFGAVRARNEHRPAVRGEVDWARVDFEYESFWLVTNSPTNPERLTPVYRERLSMLQRWSQGDYAGAAGVLQALQEREPNLQPTAIERLALAEMHAHSLYSGALGWIDTYTSDQPTLRAALSALWELNSGDRKRGSNDLATALKRYRVDPWPLPEQMARIIGNLRVRSQADRELASIWLDGLAQPFALWINEPAREAARLNIGHSLGPEHRSCLSLVRELEPHAPWIESVLQYRADCYRIHGDPLKDLAERDLRAYRAAMPAPFAPKP